MRRRYFIALLGSATITCPLTAEAQPKVRRVALVFTTPPVEELAGPASGWAGASLSLADMGKPLHLMDCFGRVLAIEISIRGDGLSTKGTCEPEWRRLATRDSPPIRPRAAPGARNRRAAACLQRTRHRPGTMRIANAANT
jgi:hypothetical protein